MPRVVVEYLDRNDTSQTNWLTLSKFDSSDFLDLEQWETRVHSAMTVYGGGRDYRARCRDWDTNHIYQFLPATYGPLSNLPNNDEVEWNLPTNPGLTGEIRHMIKVGISRVNGKLTLLINASEFHKQLDEIGCTYTATRYNDRPAAANTVASSTHMMSTEMLLLRDYREVELKERVKKGDSFEIVSRMMPVTATADLSTVWTNPPSFENLKKLCNSANDAARKILEHYQPIDISVEIHKKVVK